MAVSHLGYYSFDIFFFVSPNIVQWDYLFFVSIPCITYLDLYI